MSSRFLNRRANRLTEALDGAMATHISSASVPDQVKAVLALIQSDEVLDLLRGDYSTQAALIAYLTADALTKEAE